jgi:hypothetical protein
MRPSFCALLCLPPLALAAIVYLLVRADRTGVNHELIADPWPLAAPDPSSGEEVRRADRRSEAKWQVARDLIDGRLTLRQAGARFRDIDADLPNEARSWRSPRYTEEEWPYRQVISYVDAELKWHRRAPAQAVEWVTRLEAELREQLRHAGAPRPHPDRETAGGPER